MALRVLLADESSTIKKVFQLALQDFAVEVQPVNMGLDVLGVAKKFKPDIVFADILLQKRNGYDVSSDLKHDQDLSSTPVVLMWSGFMEMDEDKFQASQADGRLEKPFDVKTLRKVIHDLVPKTKTQKLSGFLSFPKMPEFIGDGSLKPSQASSPEPTPAESQPAKDWSMEDFDPPPLEEAEAPEEAFQAVPLPSKKEEAPAPVENPDDFLNDDEDDSRWQRQDISRFKMNQDLTSLEEEEPVTYIDPNESAEVALEAEAGSAGAQLDDLGSNSEIRTVEFEGDPDQELEVEESAQASEDSSAVPAGGSLKGLSEEKLEEIIRAQSKEVIEAVVWKVVPEIAAQIVERELKRLLDERDQLKSL